MSEAWDRVAETVKHRRTALGLSQRAAADRAKISPTTWNQFELHREPIADLTRAAMSRALQWTSDSIDRVLSGLDPTIDDQAHAPVTLEDLADSLRVIRSVVGDLVERVEALEHPRPE